MSEGGSWAPFGPSDDEPSSSPPPLAPGDPLAVPPPPPSGLPPSSSSLWDEPAPEPEPPAPLPPPVALPVPPPPQPQWQAPPSVAAEWRPPDPSTYGWSGGVTAPAGTSGKAIGALIMGILGLFLCPIVCSVIAVGLASAARGDMRANPAVGGAGLATAGAVMGWLGLVIYGFFIVVTLITL